MNAQKQTIFGALRALLFSVGLFYGGLWLAKSQDQVIVWMGIVFSLLASIAMIKAFISITRSSISTGRQFRYSLHAHTPSGILGNARLADENSSIIKKLSSIKHGLFFGAYLDALLFIDLFEKNNAHWMIYGPARSGKTTCILIPTALHWRGGSIFLPSTKMATLCICEDAWKKNGLRVCIWDPFNISGKQGLKFNLLKILVDDVQKNGGKNLLILALLIANTIIPNAAKDENPFFRKGAVRYLAGLMIFLAVILS